MAMHNLIFIPLLLISSLLLIIALVLSGTQLEPENGHLSKQDWDKQVCESMLFSAVSPFRFKGKGAFGNTWYSCPWPSRNSVFRFIVLLLSFLMYCAFIAFSCKSAVFSRYSVLFQICKSLLFLLLVAGFVALTVDAHQTITGVATCEENFKPSIINGTVPSWDSVIERCDPVPYNRLVVMDCLNFVLCVLLFAVVVQFQELGKQGLLAGQRLSEEVLSLMPKQASGHAEEEQDDPMNRQYGGIYGDGNGLEEKHAEAAPQASADRSGAFQGSSLAAAYASLSRQQRDSAYAAIPDDNEATTANVQASPQQSKKAPQFGGNFSQGGAYS